MYIINYNIPVSSLKNKNMVVRYKQNRCKRIIIGYE